MSESLSNSLCGWVPEMKKLGTEKEESGKFCNGPRRDAGTWKRRNEDAERGWDARDLLKINTKDLQKKVLCVIVLFMFILLTGHGEWPCCAIQGKAFSFFGALSPSVK